MGRVPSSKFKIADERWQAFGVKSFDEYESKYIINGRFHASVPDDVKKAYETAEYIMAQAYYHYPLLDEASNKLLRILEMAIKKRCIEIGIGLKFINKKGKEQKKDLNRLINELVKKENEKKLSRHLHVARELRNYSMHPEENSLHGILAMNIYEQMVNLINELFLSESYFKEKSDRLKDIEEASIDFKNGLFVLNIYDNSFLVQGAKPISVDMVDKRWISYWIAHPVLKNFKKLVREKALDPPFFFALREFSIGKENHLQGKLMNDSCLSINTTNDERNIEVYNQFLEEQNQMPIELMEPYRAFINTKMGSELMRFRYLNCWK
ncbi:MAG: hypothetical protein ABJH05_12280 [Fulvivirga sp.]